MTDTTNTDHEIENLTPLSEVFGASHEVQHEAPQGDLAPQPEPEPQPAPQPAPVVETPPPPTPAAAKPEEPQHPFFYRQGLKKAKEQEEAARREAQELRRQIQALQGGNAPAAPDPYEDPNGFTQTFEQRLEMQAYNLRVEFSEQRARDRHGDNVWEETQDWLGTRPDMVQWAKGQRDPCEAAIGAYKREKLVAEMGDDPGAYREKLLSEQRAALMADPEFRASILAEMGATPVQQTQQAQARPAPPPSAANVRSATPARDGEGRFTGPKPLSEVFGKR